MSLVLFLQILSLSICSHRRDSPQSCPWRLALVTVIQFAENLPDRQAADAERSRIDWKYALALELTDPGFDYSVLCEFRSRLLQSQAEQRLLETVLCLARERGWLKCQGRKKHAPVTVCVFYTNPYRPPRRFARRDRLSGRCRRL